MGKGKKIPLQIRKLIINHHKNGYGYKKIAEMVQLTKNTVATIVKKYKKIGTVEHQKGQGRKKKTSHVVDRAIINKVRGNRKLSAPKIAAQIENEYGIKMKAQTVRNRLNDKGYKGHVAVKKPWLSSKNIKKRLSWANDHSSWSIEEWKRVLWSDESRICLFGSDGLIRSWRKPGERLFKDNLRPTVKHGGGDLVFKVVLYDQLIHFLCFYRRSNGLGVNDLGRLWKHSFYRRHHE